MFSGFGAVVQLGVRFAPGACEVEGSNPSGPTSGKSVASVPPPKRWGHHLLRLLHLGSKMDMI